MEKDQTKAGRHFDASFSTVAVSAAGVCGATGPLFARAFLARRFFVGFSVFFALDRLGRIRPRGRLDIMNARKGNPHGFREPGVALPCPLLIQTRGSIARLW
jgi:hypothetical protein